MQHAVINGNEGWVCTVWLKREYGVQGRSRLRKSVEPHNSAPDIRLSLRRDRFFLIWRLWCDNDECTIRNVMSTFVTDPLQSFFL